MRTTTDLLPHQALAVAKLLPTRIGALFMDMGTGKSRTTLELACIRQHKWDRLFWFAPCTLKETIYHEILRHTDATEEDIALWGERVTDDLLPLSARFHIIGIESMSASDRTVLAYAAIVTEQSFVVVDESSYIKGHDSLRTLRITELSARTRYRLILTGTPFSNGVADLYAQTAFLSKKILGYTSFYSFAANHLEFEMRRDNFGVRHRTDHVIRAHNVEYLAAKIAPYTYQVRKSECLELPDKLYETRYFRMTDEQRRAYELAKDEILRMEIEDWTSIAIFRLFTALQAIVCGFWTRTDPKTHQKERLTFSHQRITVLQEVIDAIPAGEQIIIWSKYQHAIGEIRAALQQREGADAVAEFHGAVPQHHRYQELHRWRIGAARYLLATQSTGGHGLTLNESAYAIFYADGYKYSERVQAEDRCVAKGQLVMTLDGLRPIETIQVGDQVITHTGSWRKVIKTSKRQHRSLMTQITYRRYSEPLLCTHDHRILLKRGDALPQWFEAHEALPGDFLVVPRPVSKEHREPAIITSRHSGTLVNNWGIEQTNGRYKHLVESFELTDDLLWLFGWYLAEGFASTVSGKGRFISLAAHQKERPILERMQRTFSGMGVNSTIYTKNNSKAIELRAYSYELAYWFGEQFGAGCESKHVPEFCFHLPREQAQTLLDAYIEGDGYERGKKREWVSISQTLASQMIFLASQCGHAPTLRQIHNHGPNEGYWIGGYTVDGQPDSRALATWDDQYVYNPIREVKTFIASKIPTYQMVYDLTVEEDHSFVVGQAIVHNCHRIGQTRQPTYVSLCCAYSIDERIRSSLERKENMLRSFQQQVQRYRAEGMRERARKLIHEL